MAADNLALALATAVKLYQQAQIQAQHAQKEAEELKIKQMMLQKAMQPDPMAELDRRIKTATAEDKELEVSMKRKPGVYSDTDSVLASILPQIKESNPDKYAQIREYLLNKGLQYVVESQKMNTFGTLESTSKPKTIKPTSYKDIL